MTGKDIRDRITQLEFFESTLPSPATRELRRELQDLSDEDLNCLIHIVKRMKGTDT